MVMWGRRIGKSEMTRQVLMAQMYRELINALESDRTFGDSYHETVEEGLRVYEIAKAEGRI